MMQSRGIRQEGEAFMRHLAMWGGVAAMVLVVFQAAADPHDPDMEPELGVSGGCGTVETAESRATMLRMMESGEWDQARLWLAERLAGTILQRVAISIRVTADKFASHGSSVGDQGVSDAAVVVCVTRLGEMWMAKAAGLGKPQSTCTDRQDSEDHTKASLGHHQCRRAAHNQRHSGINEQQDSENQARRMWLPQPHQIPSCDLVSLGRIGPLSGRRCPRKRLKPVI
jgi:hypothetical protein